MSSGGIEEIRRELSRSIHLFGHYVTNDTGPRQIILRDLSSADKDENDLLSRLGEMGEMQAMESLMECHFRYEESGGSFEQGRADRYKFWSSGIFTADCARPYWEREGELIDRYNGAHSAIVDRRDYSQISVAIGACEDRRSLVKEILGK